MYHGSCLCGSVKFSINGEINDIVYCHCSQCRKVQGTAFATNGVVAAEDFTFQRGEDVLSEYEYGLGKRKYFCKNCGSPIMSKNESFPNVVRIRLGTIESDIKERPACHIFVGSKANWDEICDDLPQFVGFPD